MRLRSRAHPSVVSDLYIVTRITHINSRLTSQHCYNLENLILMNFTYLQDNRHIHELMNQNKSHIPLLDRLGQLDMTYTISLR